MQNTGRSPTLRYGVVVLSVAIVTLIRLLLHSILGGSAAFLPFEIAVMFSAWYGGLKPGLLATLLAVFVASYLFVERAGHLLAITHPRDAVQLALFSVIGAVISFVIDALQSEVAERRHAEQTSKAQTQALVDVIERLAQEHQLESLQGLVLAAVVNQLDAAGGALWSHEEATDLSAIVLDCQHGRVMTAEAADHPLAGQPIANRETPAWAELKAAYLRGECLQVPDLLSDTRLHERIRTALLRQGARSFLMVPMRLQGRLVGFYSARNSRPTQYGPAEIQLAQALAHQATLAIQLTGLAGQAQEAAVLQERVQAAAARVAELSRANQALLHTLDALADAPELERFLGTVIAAITEQLGAASSSLWLLDRDGGTMDLALVYQDGRVVPAAASGHPNPVYTLFEGTSAPDWITRMQERRAWVDELATSSMFSPATRDHLAAQGVQRVVMVPLALGDDLIGVFSARLNETEAIAPEKIALAHAIAHQATLAIHITRLAAQARQTAVVEERNRLAREIHDTLAQAFTGILLQLGAAERLLAEAPERGQEHLRNAGDLAREGLAEARRSVRALRPHALDQLDLGGALARMAERLNAGQATRIDFRLNGAPRPLPPDVADHLLRMGQEALTNALRHAQANEVCVELTFATAELRLLVRDDGRGFASGSASQHGGFGLTGLRERAAIIGAHLSIASRPGSGTHIELTWPLPAG